jgi:pantoate--beta-alanine ligase
MRVFDDIEAWRAARGALGDASVGFVPTMGALHEGHLQLIRRAAEECDRTVVSVFVNAPQFDDQTDLARYPRVLEEDARLAADAGADFVLAPTHDAMYRDRYRFKVTETDLSRTLEGAHRPGHFDGVLTVVLKLLNLVRPNRAYFGEKDYQQYLLIRGMAAAFFLDTEIVPCPTVRDVDGLALSSRNALLGPEARALAPRFAELMGSGERPEAVRLRLQDAGFEVDYVEDVAGRRYGAVRLAGVRLIDNLPLDDHD